MVSNLFFIDDTLIFGRATVDELVRVKEILRSYEATSGQIIYLIKSNIIFTAGTRRLEVRL